jgi:hypothetical protein
MLWVVAGTPWWSPAAGLAPAILVRLLGSALPRRLRRPLLAGCIAATVALAAELSVWAWLLLAAGGMVEVIMLAGPRIAGPGQRRPACCCWSRRC